MYSYSYIRIQTRQNSKTKVTWPYLWTFIYDHSSNTKNEYILWLRISSWINIYFCFPFKTIWKQFNNHVIFVYMYMYFIYDMYIQVPIGIQTSQYWENNSYMTSFIHFYFCSMFYHISMIIFKLLWSHLEEKQKYKCIYIYIFDYEFMFILMFIYFFPAKRLNTIW